MFSQNPLSTEAPSLKFTKAELVYIVSVILAELKPTDDHVQVEMVELRHYLNQIRDKVVMAAHSGDLPAVGFNIETNTVVSSEKKHIPSIKELKEKFPSLSEEEIEEIINTAKDRKDEEPSLSQEFKPQYTRNESAAFSDLLGS